MRMLAAIVLAMLVAASAAAAALVKEGRVEAISIVVILVNERRGNATLSVLENPYVFLNTSQGLLNISIIYTSASAAYLSMNTSMPGISLSYSFHKGPVPASSKIMLYNITIRLGENTTVYNKLLRIGRFKVIYGDGSTVLAIQDEYSDTVIGGVERITVVLKAARGFTYADNPAPPPMGSLPSPHIGSGNNTSQPPGSGEASVPETTQDMGPGGRVDDGGVAAANTSSPAGGGDGNDTGSPGYRGPSGSLDMVDVLYAFLLASVSIVSAYILSRIIARRI